ncbi:UNVERIFIED_CONTAM: hypothetical protein FKN15_009265 [Acipenser sinensis]
MEENAGTNTPVDPERKTMDPECKELLEEIKKNNAVQEDLNKKWRQERGLPDPEPTELQLMFQRWVRSAEAPLSPAPEGEAPLSPAPEGEATIKGEKVKIPPPQPRPPPLKTSPAPDGAVPCPDVVVPLPECQDLPPLVLTPRSQHCRAQLLAWSPTPLLLDLQTSRREGQTSRALPLSFTLFPLKLHTSLRGSAVAHLCPSLLAPGCRPALQSPWSSRPGSPSLVRGPFQEMPEGPNHPQARPQEGAKIDICGLEDRGILKKARQLGSAFKYTRIKKENETALQCERSCFPRHACEPEIKRRTAKIEAGTRWRLDASAQQLLYAFPPLAMLLLCLEKIRQDWAKVLLVAPYWSRRLVFNPDAAPERPAVETA